MKQFHRFLVFMAVVALSACSSQHVVSDHWVQKRKYRPGFHLDALADLRKEHDQKTMKDSSNRSSAPLAVIRSLPKPTPSVHPVYHRNTPRKDVSIARPESVERVVLSGVTQPLEVKHDGGPEDPEGEEGGAKVPVWLVGAVALTLAIVNVLVFIWIPYVGLLTTILSIVFAINAIRASEGSTKVMGVSSLIINIASLLVALFMTAVMMLALELFPEI